MFKNPKTALIIHIPLGGMFIALRDGRVKVIGEDKLLVLVNKV